MHDPLVGLRNGGAFVHDRRVVRRKLDAAAVVVDLLLARARGTTSVFTGQVAHRLILTSSPPPKSHDRRVPIWPVLLLAFLATAGTATAGKIVPRCPSPTPTALSALIRSAPDAIVLEFRGEDAKIGIRIFNSLPPVGREVGDRFYIAVRPGLPSSRLLIGNNGCIENSALVDAQLALMIHRAIKKYRAANSI